MSSHEKRLKALCVNFMELKKIGSGVYSFYEPVSEIRDPRFMLFFLLPSFSFGIAMFPRIAAEYSENYLPMLRSGMLRYFGIFGWLLICCLAIVIAF